MVDDLKLVLIVLSEGRRASDIHTVSDADKFQIPRNPTDMSDRQQRDAFY